MEGGVGYKGTKDSSPLVVPMEITMLNWLLPNWVRYDPRWQLYTLFLVHDDFLYFFLEKSTPPPTPTHFPSLILDPQKLILMLLYSGQVDSPCCLTVRIMLIEICLQ